jgi:polyferredoxin
MDDLGWPVKLFLDFDPLIFITNLLASHSIASGFYLSLILIALTLPLGRVFCGWVCPFGTLHNLAGCLKKKGAPKKDRRNWYRFKYYILIFLLISSLFTLQLTGFLDPLSLLIRSFSLHVYPVFNYLIRSFFEGIFPLSWPVLTGISEALYTFFKNTVLAFDQPYFYQSLLIGLLFWTLIALNLVERRFWCRYLCPLGALLGLLSRYSLLDRSVSEECDGCGVCRVSCQGDARPDQKEQWKNTECIACFNCDDVCPNNAVHFGFFRNKTAPALDLGKRRVIGSALTGILAVPFFRVTPFTEKRALDPRLIRPPGALEEKEFLKRCVKCGECMKVCLTNGLQPTLLEAGLEGLWSPVLVPRIGHCEYRCTLCGQVCPTGAIRRLPWEEKTKIKIGLAMIDQGRCLPYAHGTPCIVCEEVCPTPKKAIWFEEIRGQDRQGKKVLLKQPRVDLSLCIGCGVCEAKCPVQDQPAIYVTSIGESRSKENQLLLAP